MSDELPENPGPGWWDRVFHRLTTEKQRQDAEAEHVAQIQAALNQPWSGTEDFAEQRKLLGLDKFGLDGQTHGELRRLS